MGMADWPDPPPPSFADPRELDSAYIRSALVVLNGEMVLPFAKVPFRNTEFAESTVRELVAAVGTDTLATKQTIERNVFVAF
jgi:hypothetical protein